jgi:hypothetical protein
MNRKIVILISLLTVCLFIVSITDGFSRRNTRNYDKLQKPADAVRYLQDVGNLWTVVSNYGWIGDDAFNNPSFEWPGGSGNHHLYQGSIWVAAKDPGGVVHVTAGEEEEFTQTTDPNDYVYHWTKNDVLSEADIAMGKTEIISENDTWAVYSDLDPQYHTPGDSPLGVRIIEQCYGWSAGYNDDFLIFDYQIINVGLVSFNDYGIPDLTDTTNQRTLEDVYIGVRFDFDLSYLASGEYWYDDLAEYDADHNLSYGYDGDDPDFPGNDIGEAGISTGYIYARLLNAPLTDANLNGVQLEDTPVSHSWWTIDDDPSTEALKFQYMSTPGYAGVPASVYDYRFLQSVGPYTLEPGDTLNITWALGVGAGLEGVFRDSDWAQRIYDSGYKAASAPDAPTFAITPGDGYMTLGWDSGPEGSVDPLSGESDFEGYRVYKARNVDVTGAPIWTLLADFDKVDDVGANTGLKYEYKDEDLVMGTGYYYAITAYDRIAEGIGSLESKKEQRFIVAEGVVANTVDDIYVVPNPYVGSEIWNHVITFNEPFEDKLVFMNLPETASIKVFTLGGDHVITIDHSGGSSANWDLISKNNQMVTSGIYLYVVEAGSGSKTGKFIVVR